MTDNPFDQFDENQTPKPAVSGQNPFNQFDATNQIGSSTTPDDYNDVSLWEAAKTGVTNLPKSALNAITAIPKTIYNAPEIESTLGEVRQEPYVSPTPMSAGQPLTPSALAKQWVTPEESGVGTPMSTEEEQAHQAARDAAWQSLIKPFTSTAGFKQTLAEDPFTYLTLLSAPFTGGASALEAGGLSTLAKASTALSYASDPLKLALGTAGKIGDIATPIIRGAVAKGANVPSSSLQTATAAGASVDPVVKDAFNTYAKGQGDPINFSRIVIDAANNVKNKAINNWAQTKEAMSGAATADVDATPILSAISEERSKLAPRELSLNTAPHDALDAVEAKINQRLAYPSGSPDRTISGFDQLKQELYSYGKDQSNPQAYNAVMGVHAGVKDALTKTAPEYQNIMQNYQDILNNVKNITQTAGTKSSANSMIAKTIKAQTTPRGQNVLDQLANEDPRIPYMVAGATLHDATPHGIAGALESAGVGINAIEGIKSLGEGDHWRALMHFGLMGAQPIIQSPSLMGKAAYGIGAAKASLPAQAIGAGVRAGKAIEPYAEPLATNVSRTELPPPQQSAGGRVPRKSGGKVQSGHQHLVDRLFRLGEQAKKTEKAHTEPLLNLPDETVARALDVAQRAI